MIVIDYMWLWLFLSVGSAPHQPPGAVVTGKKRWLVFEDCLYHWLVVDGLYPLYLVYAPFEITLPLTESQKNMKIMKPLTSFFAIFWGMTIYDPYSLLLVVLIYLLHHRITNDLAYTMTVHCTRVTRNFPRHSQVSKQPITSLKLLKSANNIQHPTTLKKRYKPFLLHLLTLFFPEVGTKQCDRNRFLPTAKAARWWRLSVRSGSLAWPFVPPGRWCPEGAQAPRPNAAAHFWIWGQFCQGYIERETPSRNTLNWTVI